MKRLALSIAGILALAVSAPAHAQIIAPPLEKRALEAGYAHKWFDRGDPENRKWDTGSLYVRFGAFERVTLYAEGGIWDIDQENPAQSYSRWVVGGGMSALLYAHGRWSADAHFTYNDMYDHDESPSRTDLRTYGWNAGVFARATFAANGQRVDFYAGPMYVDDVAQSYPFSGNDPVESTFDHWGVCAGTYARIFHVVSGFAYLLYVDAPQFRFGVSLRSAGDQP